MLEKADELLYGSHTGLYTSLQALSSLVIMSAVGFIGVVGLAELASFQSPLTLVVGVLGAVVASSGLIRR